MSKREAPPTTAALPAAPPRIGRPSKFTEEARSAAVRMASIGVGERTIAAYVGVDKRILTRWKTAHEDFALEMAQARATCTAGVWSKLIEACDGGNVRALELYLRLRTPEEFREARLIMNGAKRPDEKSPPHFLVVNGKGRESKEVAVEELEKLGWIVTPPPQ